MTVVLFEPGDQLPSLRLERAGRVLPNDVVWGVQWQDNLRKGFLLETEGYVCERGAVPAGDGLVRVGAWAAMDEDRMVLVEMR